MGLPEEWTLHRELKKGLLMVDVDEVGIWIKYGSHEADGVTWEELDAIRPFTEHTKPGKFISRAK